MLSQVEKENILQEFPDIKLSYETITHKKVYNYNLLLAIPDGNKCFAWFTSYKDQMSCFILELDSKNKKQIKKIKIINSCFSQSLCYGTIFYGTFFYHMNSPFFSIEDIFTYKGRNVSNLDINDKINKICHILKNDIKQIAYNNYFVVFGLPIIAKSNQNLESSLQLIKYKISAIKYYNSNKSNSCYLLPFEEYINDLGDINIDRKIETIMEKKVEEKKDIERKTEKITDRKYEKQPYGKIFICKPDIQNDIYHLYTSDNEYVGLAAIPDYKTSIMMNKLFRIIKENKDLDALEESDDEEEFENSNVDKFVYLDRSYKMICNFNNKFKKWVPNKIVE
jgi:hypothetical protein